MEKYINAETVKQVVRENDWSNPAVSDAMNLIIDAIPGENVEPIKEGQWMVKAWDGKKMTTIPYNKNQHDEPFCSSCKKEAIYIGKNIYVCTARCPKCGAHMSNSTM